MSAMMDVPTDEQELPEPVKLRAILVSLCEYAKCQTSGREAGTHPTSRTT